MLCFACLTCQGSLLYQGILCCVGSLDYLSILGCMGSAGFLGLLLGRLCGRVLSLCFHISLTQPALFLGKNQQYNVFRILLHISFYFELEGTARYAG